MTDQKRTLRSLELIGGVLCFDFSNTINSRHSPEHDYLTTYSDLVEWAEKVEILSLQQAKGLKLRAAQEIKNAEKSLGNVLNAREVLYRVFSAIAKDSHPRTEDLNAIARLYRDAIANSDFAWNENYFEIEWKADQTFDSLLWPIIASAEKLLLSPELSQVKECPGCGWLFLDTSKNQSRRWCSMSTCGARDKMRRYHRRLKRK